MSHDSDFGNMPNIPLNNQQQGYPIPNIPVSQDGRNTDAVTRILAANAVVRGILYRRKIINHMRDPFTSATPELGMDSEFVYRVAQHIENQTAKFRLFYFIITVVTLFMIVHGLTSSTCESYDSGWGSRYYRCYANTGITFLGIILFLIGSGLLTFFSVRILRNQYLGFFKPNSPAWFQAKQYFHIASPPTPPNIPLPNQNAVVYKGFLPFVGAGKFIDGWSFPVDLGAYTDDMGNMVMPIPFTIAEIYNELTRGIQALAFEQVELRDYLFTHGLDVMQNPLAFLPNTLEQAPMQVLPPQAVEYYANNSDHAVRFYKWIRIYDWRGEIVFSFFVRFSIRGRNLFIEFNSFVLPPLRPDLLDVDYQPHIGLGKQILLALNPITPIIESLIFLNESIKWLVFGFRTVDEIQQKLRDIRRDMRRGVPFNYGKEQSLREQFSHDGYTRFFQVMDKEMYTKIIQKEIIALIGKFLASKKVNTAQFEERVRMIVNNGIMVSGDFKISGGAVAVGEGASAKNLFNRAQKAVKSVQNPS